MAAAKPNDRIPSDGSSPVPPVNRLAECVRYYFDQPSRGFPVRSEIHFRVSSETGNGVKLARREGQGTSRWSSARPPLSAEDMRIPAWLIERLALLHYERHGLWPKLRRLLLVSSLVRWLGLQSRVF